MKADEFQAYMAPIFATFGEKNASETLYVGYYLALGDLEPEELQRALKKVIKSSRFLPKPAEILEALTGPVEDRCLLAWDQVRTAIRSHGGYASVDFADRAINAAIRSIGGWARLCGLPQGEFDVWAKKDFFGAYASHCRTGVSEDSGRYLSGLVELQEGVSEIVQIGGDGGETQVRIGSVNGRADEATDSTARGRRRLETVSAAVRSVSRLPANARSVGKEG